MTPGDGRDALTRDYRTAFLRYLSRGEETTLTIGYELGRGALTGGVSILELAQIHHHVLMEALLESRPEDIRTVAGAASSFFLEVLATSDMAQRALLGESPRRG